MTALEKKKKMNVIIMAAVLAVLAAVLIVLKLTGPEEEVKAESYTYPLTNLQASQISKVTYDYKDGSHASYQYIDNKWYNADDKQFPLSSDAFSKQFAEKFATLTSARKITEYEGGLAALGLDKPELVLSVTGTDNVTTTYKTGKYNPTLDEYYLMINDDADNIYTIEDDLIYICRSDIYDYATVDDFPAYSLGTLDYLQFVSKNDVIKLMYREDGVDEDITGYKWKWLFAEPFTRPMPCESSKIDSTTATDRTSLENELAKIQYMKTVNYKATEAELAGYGLDKPQGSYTICYNETDDAGAVTVHSVTVYIGKFDENAGGYYTREIERTGLTQTVSGIVRLLGSEYVELIMGMNPLEYTVPNVTFLSLSDIDGSTATFTIGEKKYTFSYDSGADANSYDDDVYKLGDTVIDSGKFTSLWSQLVSINAERVIFDKTTLKTEAPAYTIFADRTKDDYYGDITVRYIPYDTNYYQVEVNGEADVLMRKRDVDKFFKAMTEFADSVK